MLGGMLGWSVGGPIGGVIGFLVGSLVDGGFSVKGMQPGRDPRAGRPGRRPQQTSQGDFYVSLVVLSAAIMKADGKVLKSELEYVKRFMEQQTSKKEAAEYIKVLKGVLKKDIPLQEVGQQIGRQMQLAMRLQLIHYLFGIAQADGHVHSSEVKTIELIASYMRIPQRDFVSIKNMFFKEVDSAYKILEITKSASDKEVKKAYRRMAVRYHPDKVAQLGENVKKGAKEKFQRIQEAYEQIKKERGMN
jgi:DnaJ like chaperone protein